MTDKQYGDDYKKGYVRAFDEVLGSTDGHLYDDGCLETYRKFVSELGWIECLCCRTAHDPKDLKEGSKCQSCVEMEWLFNRAGRL